MENKYDYNDCLYENKIYYLIDYTCCWCGWYLNIKIIIEYTNNNIIVWNINKYYTFNSDEYDFSSIADIMQLNYVEKL